MMNETEQERFDELCWKYVDENIDETEIVELEGSLISHEEAREQYINIVVLHAELSSFFAQAKIQKGAAETNLSAAITDEDQFNFEKQLAKFEAKEDVLAKVLEPAPDRLVG